MDPEALAMIGNTQLIAAHKTHINVQATAEPEARTAFGSSSLIITHTTAPCE